MKKILCKTVILIFSLANYSIAQGQGSWTNFTTGDGLPDNTILTIFEASDGALWFVTPQALCHYDGDWTTFTSSNELPSDRVLAIEESNDGALWFGTEKGLTRYQDGIWKTFNTADGPVPNFVDLIFKSRDGTLWFGGVSRYQKGIFTWVDGPGGFSVRAMFESRDGTLWFGTDGGGISRLQNGIWTNFTTVNGLANNFVHAILESRDGALWVGTSRGVSRYQNGMWETFSSAPFFCANSPIYAIVQSKDGALWFRTDKRGVCRYQNGVWTNFTKANGLVEYNINAMIESSDGALWFGTPTGVSRYQDDTFTKVNELANNDIRAILETSDGAMWFGTYGSGVSRYQVDFWTTFTTDDSLADNLAGTIIESSDKALWFGTYRGVSRYKDGIWTNFNSAKGLVNDTVYAIIESSDGALWFGTRRGVSRYQNEAWTTYTTNNGLASNEVYGIAESSDGVMWFATQRGVSRFHGGTWTTFTPFAHYISVTAILASSDDAIWVGGGPLGGGVSRYQNGVWTTVIPSSGYVSLIFESSDGALWFHIGIGLVFFRYHNDEWKIFIAPDGRYINEIGESSDGALWFGSDIGVTRHQHDLRTTFTKTDGLAGNSVGAIIESSDRFMWFGTGEGVSRLRPDRNPPFTFIIGDPEKTTGTPTPLFRFNGRDFFTKQEQLFYSYAVVESSIIPDSSHWQPFGQLTSIQTRPLQNGTYTFHVRARDSWGNIDPIPAKWTFTVDITPPTVTFNSHKANDIVAGQVAIIGNAFDNSPINDFDYYNLQYGFGETQKDVKEWKTGRFTEYDSLKQVFNDTLAIWNTEGLPNGPYLLQLSAYDTLKHESHVFLNLEVAKSTATVDSRSGSNFVLDAGKLELYFPPNTFPKDTPLNVRDCLLQDIVPKADPQVKFANLCFEIAPHELRLDKPATLTLYYPDSALTNKNEKKLALYHSADGKSNWQRLGGSVDVEENKITTTFKQAGVFALYEDLSTGNKAGIMNVTSQPRVFSPQGGGFNTQTAISFDLGKESNVTIKIYNAAGRLVRVLTENEPMSYGTQVQYWDGKDQSGHYCLSGLHLVTIQAEDKMVTKTVVVLNK